MSTVTLEKQSYRILYGYKQVQDVIKPKPVLDVQQLGVESQLLVFLLSNANPVESAGNKSSWD